MNTPRYQLAYLGRLNQGYVLTVGVLPFSILFQLVVPLKPAALRGFFVLELEGSPTASNGVPGGTISPGTERRWNFSFGGNGDQGAQYSMANPPNPSGLLMVLQDGKLLDANGHYSHAAVAQDDGPPTVNFSWSDGGLSWASKPKRRRMATRLRLLLDENFKVVGTGRQSTAQADDGQEVTTELAAAPNQHVVDVEVPDDLASVANAGELHTKLQSYIG